MLDALATRRPFSSVTVHSTSPTVRPRCTTTASARSVVRQTGRRKLIFSSSVVNGRRYPLRAGTLELIERGDTHEIRNTGRTPLRTLNVYVPPAYTQDGDPLPRGRG